MGAIEKNYRQIDKNAHYFCQMRPIQSFMGIMSFTSSTDPYMWFECEVDESRYKVDDNYKITLRAINGCACESYYQSDFLSLMYEGLIIKKTSDDMHIEFVEFNEHIPNTVAYIHHQGQCVVGTVEPIKVGDKVRIRDFGFLVNVLSVNENTATVAWECDGEHHQETLFVNELVRV